MKKIIKIIFCLIIVIALIIMPNQGFAASSSSDNPPPTFGDVLNAGSSFINSGVNSNTIVPTDESIRATSNLIYNVLPILGILIIIIWGMVLGIKFITGSVEQQAEVKKGLIPYGVGCVIIFGAYTIWSIVVNIASQFG